MTHMKITQHTFSLAWQRRCVYVGPLRASGAGTHTTSHHLTSSSDAMEIAKLGWPPLSANTSQRKFLCVQLGPDKMLQHPVCVPQAPRPVAPNPLLAPGVDTEEEQSRGAKATQDMSQSKPLLLEVERSPARPHSRGSQPADEQKNRLLRGGRGREALLLITNSADPHHPW